MIAFVLKFILSCKEHPITNLFTTCVLFAILFNFSDLYSEDEKPTNKIACLSEFTNFESTENKKLSEQIYSKISEVLNSKKMQIKKIIETKIEDKISSTKKENCHFLVDGFYKKLENENLQLYSQIYNPETGLMIDAFNITDEISESIGIKLDSTESKELDSTRILNFSKRLNILLLNNWKRQEKRESINEFVLFSKISRNKKFPISSGKEAEEEAAKQVFSFLQSQVTFSSTKTEKKASEAPNIISVITEEEIRNYGRVSLNDILYQLPGFAPSQDYDRRTVTGRGIFEGWNNNHILTLMDGVQFNDNLYGTAYTWEITPLNMIKSIEVIRGPGSALYGSNATNGVVSINTFSGSDLKGGIKTRIRSGDAGTQIYDVLTGNTGKIFSYIASYNIYKTKGNNYMDTDSSGRLDAFGFPQKFPVKDERNSSYLFTKLEGEGVLKGLSIQFHKSYWSYESGHGWLWRIPDSKENMSESRQIATIKYSKNITDKLIQEYVMRYQERGIDWNTRYAENGAYENFYPGGVSEYLKTSAKDIFLRGQLTYLFGNGGSLLSGVEGTNFRYNGDKEHYSNINLSDSVNGYPPYDDNSFQKQGPWFEWIKKKPVNKGAAFAQVVSGKILYNKLELTAGVRYDETVVKFRGIDQRYSSDTGIYIEKPYDQFVGPPLITNDKRIFRRTSPRLGAVFFITKNLNLKLISGRAFREPAMTELFGANTFSLASNPRKLKPEVIQTNEIGIDYFLNRYINLRGNYFRTRFENQIAYSLQNNNLSSNIYTLVTHGLETELIFSYKYFSGFANMTYIERLNEFIQDNTISANKDHLTWAPSHRLNLGFSGNFPKFNFSLSFERQGLVYRKTSDMGSVDPLTGFGPLDTNTGEPISYQNTYPQYRPKDVPPWVNLNTRFVYKIHENVHLGVFVSNALNSCQTLIKNNYYPFDYQRDSRRIMFDFSANF
ncbi:MAG: TonB-dependent receptor [Leptospiraceae bacterium]|nr:TonB-dependent receptor [Leptospiraceae bacterium]MCK6379792.1 TonB-dependent receptor [Leptospiraceae bacterium]NUM41353.1 TonB-dependent receptor [Leptospiraceae bacterium]